MEAAIAAAGRPSVEPELEALLWSVVRALTPGNGRANQCASTDELRQRLAEDGVEFDPDQLAAALNLLERNGDGDYDTGALPVPYKIIRPESKIQRSQLHPDPPRPLVLQTLRIY